MRDRRRLVVFTKPALPGRVKTRLIGELGPEAAAALHQAFLDDLLERLAGRRFDLTVAWAVAPGEPLPPVPAASFAQRGADLGERLYRGLSSAAAGHELVAAVGSDHPLLTAERVEEGFERLERGSEVVLGPARDGGYYLIGLRAAAIAPELFSGVPWSTDGVLAATLERCGALGLAVDLLPMGDDVDTADDLERLTAALAVDSRSCPRTRALLERWGRLERA